MQSSEKTNDLHLLTHISDIDLRALAESEGERDIFLSVYLTTIEDFEYLCISDL